MSGEDEVLLDVAAGVATVTLNRPNSGNAMTGPMMVRLMQVVGEANSRCDVRVIVITGKGKYFCTGMDVRKGVDTGRMKPYTPFDTLWKSPKPVIARMNGPAMGGGVGLLFCCDIRIAPESAFIAFPEVALGIYPALISGYILPQLGAARTQYLMLTGQRLPAAKFEAAGVAHVVVPADKLDDAVGAMTTRLMKNSMEAQAGVKRLVQLVSYGADEHDDVMAALTGEFGTMMRSKEMAHARKVFAATGKPPNWDEYYATTRKSKL